MSRVYYRVIGFAGYDGPVKDSPEEAWAAFYRRWFQRTNGSIDGLATPILIAATTRRAALDADVAQVDGRAGRGRWWRE